MRSKRTMCDLPLFSTGLQLLLKQSRVSQPSPGSRYVHLVLKDILINMKHETWNALHMLAIIHSSFSWWISRYLACIGSSTHWSYCNICTEALVVCHQSNCFSILSSCPSQSPAIHLFLSLFSIAPQGCLECKCCTQGCAESNYSLVSNSFLCSR